MWVQQLKPNTPKNNQNSSSEDQIQFNKQKTLPPVSIIMLDINDFRAEKGGNPEAIRELQRKRGDSVELVDTIIEKDVEWRKTQFSLSSLRKQIGAESKEIGKLMKGQKDKNNFDFKAKVQTVKDNVARLKVNLADLEKAEYEQLAAVRALLNTVGNYVHPSVPVSNNEDKNAVVRVWGKFEHEGELCHHHELLWMIGGYDPDRARKLGGHRAYFLQGVAARLNLALVSFGLDFLEKRGFQAMYTPFMMLKSVMAETAQLSQFDEELYHVGESGGAPSGTEDDKYLIATSEQPLSALHRGEWLGSDVLPMKYAGQSTNFRKEAGSHGRDAWGIFRVHQFDKVEQFVLCSPSDTISWDLHEEMLKNAEEFNQELGLPYRVVSIVSGALNNAASKKYDLEAWFPTLSTFRELVSCSNCTDYQSRALEVRFGRSAGGKQASALPGGGRKQYVHMLNGTLCATTRTICCILENGQTASGITIPEVLRPYMGGMEEIKYVRECPARTKDTPLPVKLSAESLAPFITPIATTEAGVPLIHYPSTSSSQSENIQKVS